MGIKWWAQTEKTINKNHKEVYQHSVSKKKGLISIKQLCEFVTIGKDLKLGGDENGRGANSLMLSFWWKFFHNQTLLQSEQKVIEPEWGLRGIQRGLWQLKKWVERRTQVDAILSRIIDQQVWKLSN